MEKRKKLRLFWIEKGTATLGYLAGVTSLLILFLWKLSSLVPLLTREYISLQNSSTLSKIFANPIYAPYKIVQLSVHYVFKQNILYHRMVSVLFALLVVGLFYFILRYWYSMRIAIMGTVLLACSSWFLHLAREATPLITQTALLAVIAYGIWARYNQKLGLIMLIGCLLAAGLIYIPGFIWLVVVAAIWQRSIITRSLKKAPVLSIISLLIFVLLTLPMIRAVSQNINIAFDLAGLPKIHELDYQGMLNRGINIPKQLLWQGYPDASLWLPNTPVLDVFVGVMACLGLYVYINKWSLDRIKLVLVSGFIATLLIIIGGKVYLAALLPLIYLASASGIAFMIQQWQTVFPNNPLARRLGVLMMALVVAASCFYQLNHYFIAWPQSPQTKSGFHLRH